MKHLKGFLFTIVGLFIMVTLVSLLIPSTVIVARGVAINGDADKVYKEVSNLRNWKHWHPVFKQDSINVNYSADSGLNSFCEWTTNDKINRLQIDSLLGDRVTIVLSRPGQNNVVNTIRLLPIPGDRSVQVEWRAFVKLKWYPWEKFYGLFIEKTSGDNYENALNSLKEYIEHH
jgi:hypothetical protein